MRDIDQAVKAYLEGKLTDHPELLHRGHGGSLGMDYQMHPIGIIHTPFTEKTRTPSRLPAPRRPGSVEISPDFAEGLQDLDGFSHIILLYVFHEAGGYDLHVKPFLDDQLRGLLATRYPARPNQIGLSVVRLTSQIGPVLQVEGLDMSNGTPLLDIEPYVPEFDVRSEVRIGWYETTKSDVHFGRHWDYCGDLRGKGSDYWIFVLPRCIVAMIIFDIPSLSKYNFWTQGKWKRRLGTALGSGDL